MKAQNIQSNTSAPFLAGRAFGTFHTEQDAMIVTRLVKDAKAIHCAQDLKDYCNGYKETLTGSDGSKDTRASMVRTVLKVATALDKKLCEYHKVKTPAAGQKVVQKQIDKGAKGIDSLSKALRIPSAGKADSAGESEPTANDAPSLESELKAFVKKQHENGHTNLDIGNAMAAMAIELCRA
jgi:hypothetical protein